MRLPDKQTRYRQDTDKIQTKFLDLGAQKHRRCYRKRTQQNTLTLKIARLACLEAGVFRSTVVSCAWIRPAGRRVTGDENCAAAVCWPLIRGIQTLFLCPVLHAMFTLPTPSRLLVVGWHTARRSTQKACARNKASREMDR